MTIEAWAAFAASTLLLVALPGPTNLVLVSYGLGLGRAAVWPAVLGVTLGRLLAMTFAALGTGLLAASSPQALWALQALGLATLAWLGVGLWRQGDRLPRPQGAVTWEGTGKAAPGRVLRHACAATALNPFNIASVAVLFPHAAAGAERPWAEAAAMGALVLAIGLAVSLLYALLAARAHGLWASRRFVQGANRCGGALLMGGALALALGT